MESKNEVNIETRNLLGQYYTRQGNFQEIILSMEMEGRPTSPSQTLAVK